MSGRSSAIRLVDERGAIARLETQAILWDPAAWDGVRRLHPEADAVIDHLDSQGGTILRQTVVDAFGLGGVAGFVAAMIWGFGPTSYGPVRLSKMFSTTARRADLASVVPDVVLEAQSGDPARAFRSLWSSRRSRICGLGTAFGTKLLYFASRSSGSSNCLVLDQFVFKGAERLWEEAEGLGERRVPDPRVFLTGAGYGDYCAWAHDVCPDVPDAVELALFGLGKQQGGAELVLR